MKIFMGWDDREKVAFDVAQRTLRKFDLEATPLNFERLAAAGLFRRLVDRRGQFYDIASNAPCSTDFAASRFLTPLLAQSGWALFVDCDVVFLRDPRDMLLESDARFAVQVVKHKNGHTAGKKMGGLAQQVLYPRKNWSSVMLFNCDHPANRRLTLADVNERPGRDLHAFYWLADSEIGGLDPSWNWLVGVQPKPESPRIAHFTLGGPWLAGWQGAEYDEVWTEAAR